MRTSLIITAIVLVLAMALCAGLTWKEEPLVSLISIGLLFVYLFFVWFFNQTKE